MGDLGEQQEALRNLDLMAAGGAVTSHVLSTAFPSIRLTNSKPKYFAPRTRASSSGLDADNITLSSTVGVGISSLVVDGFISWIVWAVDVG